MKDDKVFDFIKLLVETGNTHYVDENNFVIQTFDDNPVLIPVDKKGLPLLVFNKNMKSGDHVLLNPFVEQLGISAERKWFYTALNIKLGHFVKGIMTSLIIKINNGEDLGYDKLELVESVSETKIDGKLLKEVTKIPPQDFVNIMYHKKSRIAQLQSRIMDPEYKDSIKGVRKSSWMFIENFFTELFGSDFHDDFKHKATVIGCQKADGFLHVFAKALDTLSSWIDFLLPDNKVEVGNILAHLENLEEYHKSVVWFANTIIAPKDDEPEIEDVPPWLEQIQQQQPQQTIVQQQPMFVSAANIAGPVPATQSTLQSGQYQQQQQMMHNPYPQQQQMMHNPYQQQQQMMQNPYQQQQQPMNYQNQQGFVPSPHLVAPVAEGYSAMDEIPAPRI